MSRPALTLLENCKKAVAWALFQLLKITEAELATVPGTTGEMECDTNEGVHVFTKDGRIKKRGLKRVRGKCLKVRCLSALLLER